MSEPGDPPVPAPDAERRAKLQALQTTARDLLRARSETEIARVAVETARDVLDCPLTGVWLYDADDGTLHPAAVTDEGREVLGEPISFAPGEGLAWRAFKSGEVGVYDDVRTVEGVYNPETPVRSEIDLPLGPYGVLTTATTRRAEFSAADIDLLQILAANVEAVLDRTAREREVARYQEMVEAADDPIWAVDAQGRLTHLNERLVDLAPGDRSDLLGEPMSTAFPDAVSDRALARLDALRERDERATVYRETVHLPGGNRREFQLSIARLSEDGDHAGAVFVAHDVTELRGSQQRLSVFNRVLRHNLRNKLNVISGHLEYIATDGADDELGEHVASAQAAADSLRRLGEKAQRFRSITEPGGATVSTVELASVASRSVASARETDPTAAIHADLEEGVRARAHGTLEFAIRELIENAIQHTAPETTPDVSVTVRGGDDTAEIRVADNGPGLRPMDRRALERDIETPLEHAAGLGLWLVRWTVTTSGGSIAVREVEPTGSEFVIRLPAVDPGDD